MTSTGIQFSDEFMRFRPGSLLFRSALSAVSGLALLAASAGSGHADPTPAASLPTVSITTASIAPMDMATTIVTAPPDAGVVATVNPAAAAQSKPAVHRARRLQLQTIDTASLSGPTSVGLLGNGLIGHARVIEARATTLRPAPLPDQDVDAPGPDAQALAAQQEASVAPSFYGNKDHFSGDGFSEGSNLESDKNNRRKPGGGMSLSIPVQ